MRNCFQKVGPGSGKGQVTFRMVMLVLFHKEQGQTDISRRNMLTSCKTDDLSSGKYPFPKDSGYLHSQVTAEASAQNQGHPLFSIC